MLEIFKQLILRWVKQEDSETIVINQTRFVLSKGTYKEDYDNAWLYALASRSKYFLDIGASYGFHTIIGFGAGIKRSVVVDANARALTKAASNVFENGLASNVNFYKGFVSDKDDDEITFWAAGAGAAGSMYASHAKTAKLNGSSTQISTTTIDTIVSLFNFQPDLIKVDVEGAESKVLQGAVDTTKKYQPDFLVEMHSLAELSMELNMTLVLNWCQQNNYAAYYLKEHTLLTDPSVIKHRGRCHVLLMAKNKPYPEELRSIVQGAIPKEFVKGSSADV